MYQMILIAFINELTLSAGVIVHIAQGKLRGQINEGYVSFGGIPYATVADPNRKYKRLGVAPSWTGIREYQEVTCTIMSESEECLQLHVNVPTESTAPWPVLVWVTGGGGIYNPSRLVKQGVSAVIVNHRFGPAGFLCPDDERIPGNSGVKDVITALRWVRDNIVAFKGNPHKVVVAGQGFAAALVEAMLVSPMAEGLFHGAILQSGTSIAPWAFNYDAKGRAADLATFFNISSDDVIDTLLNTSEAEMAIKSEKLNFPYIPFGLCVESPSIGEERFLSEPPIDLMKKKIIHNVPLIVGFNSDEAYIFVSYFKRPSIMKIIATDIGYLLPEELKLTNKDEITNTIKKLKDFYFNKNISVEKLLAYHRDAYFVSHIHRSAILHATAGLPVYFYQFSHASGIGIEEEIGVKKSGASHSDELAYLFPDRGKELGGDDAIVQRQLVKLWTNFIKFLDPTPESTETIKWDTMDQNNPRILDITTNLKMTDYPYKEATALWQDIYDRHYFRNKK